jgi:GGDEF domain-containing protein
MFRFRLWLGIFVWWMVVFYNIERVTEPVNIASFVYVLAPLAAGLMILLPRLFKRPTSFFIIFIVLVLVVFFALKMIFGYEILGSNFAITVTEVASILITLFLTRQISFTVWDFEDTVANLTFRQIGLPPRLYETTDTEDLYREVKRSRRFKHPLSLLVVRPDFDLSEIQINRLLLDIQKTFASRYIQARLARLLSEDLRDTDLIVVQDDEFVILLPETEAAGGNLVKERLERTAREKLGIRLRVGQAAFPETAVTLNGLLEVAGRSLESSQPVGDGPASGSGSDLPRTEQTVTGSSS